jgi:hypothetical protein
MARGWYPNDMGTRFRLYPQAPYGSATPVEPETVWLAAPPGSIGPGPQDDRMYTVDPVGKAQPYGIVPTPQGGLLVYGPPWRGPIRPPARPDAEGHFDHLEADTPEFEPAHAYGCARFVLDVWETYFGRPLRWHFERDYRRLEISLLRDLDNATAGYGFMELGANFAGGKAQLFSLNFDIIAHEIGHLIIYSELGLPRLDQIEGEYFGFHESAADLCALVSVLHFDAVVDDLLATTSGNLYTFNELNRFAELSEVDQIRVAGNASKLSDFALGWSDEHDLSQPLTGAIFDTFIDIFHESLVDRALISPEVEDLMDRIEREPKYEGVIQALFDQAFAANPPGFKLALLDARDHLGAVLAETWRRLSPNSLNYDDVGDLLLDIDVELTGGRFQQAILNNFLWRDIGVVAVGPRLFAPGPDSHALSVRTLTPESLPAPQRLSYRERWEIARRAPWLVESMPAAMRSKSPRRRGVIGVGATPPSETVKREPAAPSSASPSAPSGE